MSDNPEDAALEGQTVLTDEVAQKERAKTTRQLARERADVLRDLLSTTQGRRWFAWLLHDLCGLYRPVANAAFDPHSLHFREGSRAVGQVLHDMALREAHDRYIVLLSETLHKT